MIDPDRPVMTLKYCAEKMPLTCRITKAIIPNTDKLITLDI